MWVSIFVLLVFQIVNTELIDQQRMLVELDEDIERETEHMGTVMRQMARILKTSSTSNIDGTINYDNFVNDFQIEFNFALFSGCSLFSSFCLFLLYPKHLDGISY